MQAASSAPAAASAKSPAGERPTVTVVVAAWPDLAGTADVLAQLAAQRDADTQVIVCSRQQATTELLEKFPWAEWKYGHAGDLIPHLWADGLRLAESDFVAITTNHFLPATDWIAQIRASLSRANPREIAGVGGAIEPPLGNELANWATFFLRYSSQFAFQGVTRVHDTAGDNVVYRASVVRRHMPMFTKGFWEPEFHRALVRDGTSLLYDPSVRVRQVRCFGVKGFCAQRFEHGRHYGENRMQPEPVWLAWIAAAMGPLIPLILLAKVTRNAVRRPALLFRFLFSLPILVLFVCSWAAGEVAGYVATAVSPRSESP